MLKKKKKELNKNFSHYFKSCFETSFLTASQVYGTRILKTQSYSQSLAASAFFKSFMKYLKHRHDIHLQLL